MLLKVYLMKTLYSYAYSISAKMFTGKYGDQNDSSMRDAAHRMYALAFVPIDHVVDLFD